MKKRDFIKSSLLSGIGLIGAKSSFALTDLPKKKNAGPKHWVWENPNQKEDEKSLKEKYIKFFEAGIRGMFFENDSELHFRMAKAAGLEAHRWMWTMNRGEKELLEKLNIKNNRIALSSPDLGELP